MTSLRVQLAVVGFLAMYLPALFLHGVTVVTEEETTVVDDGVEVTQTSDHERSPWADATVVALCPAAALLAWWLAGRAVRPINEVRAVAEDIEATDLGRRIGLVRGPAEMVALAASFDAMLARLEESATIQRRLVEEASHELRTPLSVMATNAEVLLVHPEPTVELYREGLERSLAAAGRLHAAIDELLVDARGRARTIHRKPADLVDVVRSVVDEVQLLATPRSIDVTLTVPSSGSVVCPIDEATVRRAIANLVDNAVRYSPDGTTVTVDVLAPEGSSDVTIAVTDQGPGIPADQQDHIFERFWRGRADTHGTGLGLPIAHQVALAHGGTLTVTSPTPDAATEADADAGPGSTFTLRLPRW